MPRPITSLAAAFFTALAPTALSSASAGPPATLVINELDYDQVGTDTTEFIEIMNVSDSGIDLDPYSVVLVNGANNIIYQTIDLPSHCLPPGGYFVICGTGSGVTNCDFQVMPGSNLIQNGAPDAVAILLGKTIIDALSYEGSVPGYTEGTGTTAADDNVTSNLGLSRVPNGSDTDNNAADFQLTTTSPGAANIGSLQGATCVGDISNNGIVNVDDLLAVINGWGSCADPNDCPADIAPPCGNDIVDVDDLLTVINNWGPCF